MGAVTCVPNGQTLNFGLPPGDTPPQMIPTIPQYVNHRYKCGHIIDNASQPACCCIAPMPENYSIRAIALFILCKLLFDPFFYGYLHPSDLLEISEKSFSSCFQIKLSSLIHIIEFAFFLFTKYSRVYMFIQDNYN